MEIESARTFFEVLAARGREPRLADAVGTWEFDIEGAGTWTVMVDQGAFRVSEGPKPGAGKAGGEPTTRLRMREDEFLRIVRGEGHQNLVTALLRGALAIEGQLAFGQRLQTILPVPEEWRTGP